MDKLRRDRGVKRSCVTRIVTELETEIAKADADPDLLQARNTQLEKVMSDVIISDQKIMDAMLDANASDDELEQEYTVVQEYKYKVELIVIKVNKKLNPEDRTTATPPGSVYSDSASRTGNSRTFKLPKIELKKFDGELTEWLGWWAQFKKIHEDPTLDASDKFQYLVQAMEKGTPAKQLVESYPQSEDNYPKVVEALQERFGSHDLLVEVYARELQRLVIRNATSKGALCLSALYDKLESRLRALESLCPTAEKYSVLLFTMVESSLDNDLLRAWNRSSLSSCDGLKENPPKNRLDYLMEFLRQEIKSEKRIALARGEEEKKEKKKPEKKSQHFRVNNEEFPTAAGLHVGGGSKKCIFCEKGHDSEKCGKAQSMSMDEKHSAIQKKNGCYLCLKVGHQSKACKGFVRCFGCSAKHTTIMCPQLTAGKKQSIPEKVPAPVEVKESQSALACSSGVVLKTLMVTVVTPTEQVRKMRVFIDDGSQRTYIRKKLVEELKLDIVGQESIVHSLFGGVKTDVQHHNKYLLKIKNTKGNGLTQIEALDMDKICGDISRLKAGSWMTELKQNNIWLSDIGSEQLQIDILIGTDKCGRILTGRTLQMKNGLTAVETVLGWTIMGELKEDFPNQKLAMVVTDMLVSQSSIEQLWDLEAIGINDPAENKSKEELEIATKQHFMNTVSRSEDGRYTVSLPWINEKQEIPDNKAVAQRRLESMTKKLKMENKVQIYDEVFKSWLNERIIEEVPECEINNPAHYLPHREVFKKESSTTPVRPVFDASCKTGRAPSLNDCLEKGPNLLEEIPSILLRFREGKYGVISDIRKAFLMIEVKAADRDFLRFLWWKDAEQKELKILRHNRVVFGVNCSPFLLGAVIEHHLKNVSVEQKIIAEKLLQSLYVDNCVTSVDSLSDYHTFKNEATKIMASAGMELRMWQSNSAEATRISPLTSRGCGLETGREEIAPVNRLTSVLGLQWDDISDTLCCNMTFVSSVEKITKRAVLSTAQKIFDPIGFLCPVLLFPKKLLQETWAKKTGWDEELNDEMSSRFTEWHKELHILNRIEIPRNATGGESERSRWQLHTFCDASKDAYAAVIFLRTENDDGEVSVQLLQAKSRVAPLKKVSIPRLELLGCTIGARLTHSVKKALGLEQVPEFKWCDSSTAITWIHRNDDWGTFVGNRVREICKLSKSQDWRHIAGTLNPADLPSRGCSALHLFKSRWWLGPAWLKKNEKDWPSEIAVVNEEEVNKERKKTVIVGMLNTQSGSPWYTKLSSSLDKTIRIVAWMSRFLNNVKRGCKKIKANQLSVGEIEAAERKLIKLFQGEIFDKKAEIISGIRVLHDEDGIICVKTKLLNREDTVSFRYPILLPNNHPFVDMLIRETHSRHGHSGTQFLMGKIREKFWILQGRRAIRKIVSNCVVCRRFNARRPDVVPAPLPQNRVKDSKAFEITGVDLAGPLFLKGKEKVWIVLFTCAVYRCVHLELVRSLSTEDFLDALSRFTDRRGRPVTIYSDNGTNFVGASNLFKGINWIKVSKVSSIKRIDWRFNPPAAAWWGGWWERLVRTVKDLLRRILGKASVSHDKLSTYLCSIESYINGRPLTTVTEDIEDLTPLTPAMFLYELPTPEVTELDFINAGDFRKSINIRKTILEEFKMRFRREYLSQLVQRGKGEKARVFRKGEVVLVGDDNKKRWQWPLAKILELIPGKDGNILVAKVKTATGILVRPIQRLYPLEVYSAAELIPEKQKKVPDERENIPEDEKVSTLRETRSGRVVKAPERYTS